MTRVEAFTIDLTSEHTLSLSEAARLLPSTRRGKRVHITTLLRWILNGVHVPTGEQVRLEAFRIGRAWFTSREALQRFAHRLTPDLNERRRPPRTAAMRTRASERAAQELGRKGI